MMSSAFLSMPMNSIRIVSPVCWRFPIRPVFVRGRAARALPDGCWPAGAGTYTWACNHEGVDGCDATEGCTGTETAESCGGINVVYEITNEECPT